MDEVSNAPVDLGTSGWLAFEDGDLAAALASFLTDGDLAAAAFASAWIGDSLAETSAPATVLDRLLVGLAARLHGAGSESVDVARLPDLSGFDVPERAGWLIALTDLAVAAAGDDWERVNAAADRLVAAVEQTGQAPHLVRVGRSTKWERLTGSIAYASGGNGPEGTAWLSNITVFRDRHHRPPAHRPNPPVAHHVVLAELLGIAADVISQARAMLDDAWNLDSGCCYPNRYAYPHQWLWDSSFNAVAWAAFGDHRAIVELQHLFTGQTADGFLPHIRYTTPSSGRGPRSDRSSYTQPPVFAHALRAAAEAGLQVTDEMIAASGRALDHLWDHRRADNGLIFIVHPWEAGTDDSPRWDSWAAPHGWDIDRLSRYDRDLVEVTRFDTDGVAVWNDRFVCCPASFNAITAWACAEQAALTGEQRWAERAAALAERMDSLLWNENEGLWDDLPLVGGGPSSSVPTVDGTLPALVTTDVDHRDRALHQLTGCGRFAGRYGRSFLPFDDPQLQPDVYWRGPAWPNLEYLLWQAARAAGDEPAALEIADAVLQGVLRAGFSEYWNPYSGQGAGGKPYAWAAVTAAIARPYLGG